MIWTYIYAPMKTCSDVFSQKFVLQYALSMDVQSTVLYARDIEVHATKLPANNIFSFFVFLFSSTTVFCLNTLKVCIPEMFYLLHFHVKIIRIPNWYLKCKLEKSAIDYYATCLCVNDYPKIWYWSWSTFGLTISQSHQYQNLDLYYFEFEQCTLHKRN